MKMTDIERWFKGWREKDLEDSGWNCPVCGNVLKEDPWGGFFLKCFNCGWVGVRC